MSHTLAQKEKTAAAGSSVLAAVDLLEESTALVDKLWDNAKYFKSEMKKLGVIK